MGVGSDGSYEKVEGEVLETVVVMVLFTEWGVWRWRGRG